MWPYNSDETLAIVRRIAKEVFCNGVSEPSFLARGSNNAAYVITENGRKYVIRVTGEWRERTTRQERWCYSQAKALGIPGPEVIAIGKVEKLPYIVLTFVEGEPGIDSNIDRDHLWRALGEYGRLINSVNIGSGSVTSEGIEVYPDPLVQWREWVDAAIDVVRNERLCELAAFSMHQRQTIRSILAEMRRRSFRLGLSHGDLDPRNAIIDESGKTHLIDWCCSLVSLVPHVDLYNILREMRPESGEIAAYLDGYGMTREKFEEVLPEVRALGLVQQLKQVGWAAVDRPDLVPPYIENVGKTVVEHLQTMSDRLLLP